MEKGRMKTALYSCMIFAILQVSSGALSKDVKPKVIALNRGLVCHSKERTSNMMAKWFVHESDTECTKETNQTTTTMLPHKSIAAGSKVACKLVKKGGDSSPGEFRVH